MLLGSWLSGRVVDVFVHINAGGTPMHDWHSIWAIASTCSAAVLVLFLVAFSEKGKHASVDGPQKATASG